MVDGINYNVDFVDATLDETGSFNTGGADGDVAITSFANNLANDVTEWSYSGNPPIAFDNDTWSQSTDGDYLYITFHGSGQPTLRAGGALFAFYWTGVNGSAGSNVEAKFEFPLITEGQAGIANINGLATRFISGFNTVRAALTTEEKRLWGYNAYAVTGDDSGRFQLPAGVGSFNTTVAIRMGKDKSFINQIGFGFNIAADIADCTTMYSIY